MESYFIVALAAFTSYFLIKLYISSNMDINNLYLGLLTITLSSSLTITIEHWDELLEQGYSQTELTTEELEKIKQGFKKIMAYKDPSALVEFIYTEDMTEEQHNYLSTVEKYLKNKQ